MRDEALTMDLLQAYEHSDQDEDPSVESSSNSVVEEEEERDVEDNKHAIIPADNIPSTLPTEKQQPTRMVTGMVEVTDIDPKEFDDLERRYATRGQVVDPETKQLKKVTPPSTIIPPPSKRPRISSTGKSKEKTSIKSKEQENVPFIPTSRFLLKQQQDYQGRSWTHPAASARTFEQMESYTPYIPKRGIFSVRAHEKGASGVKFFEPYGHLLLSTGLDGIAKVWTIDTDHGDVTTQCAREYCGHEKGIRDSCLDGNGERFLTASYDRSVKLWDVESGKVMGNFKTKGAIPYCVRFKPNNGGENEFLVGCADRNILQIDTRDANNIVQQYSQHIGAVNSVCFFEDGNRFISTSDDKILRVWDYGVPVVIKFIGSSSLHSMPTTRIHPNQKWIACQSMDNNVKLLSLKQKFKINDKRLFKGHLVSGYACGLGFSTDGRFLCSGDSIGRVFFWEWKTAKAFRVLQAHKGVTIGVDWHPTRPSLVASCGWDGYMKLWD